MSVIHDFLPVETKRLLLKTERLYLKRIESWTHLDNILKGSGKTLQEWTDMLDTINTPFLKATAGYLKAIEGYAQFIEEQKLYDKLPQIMPHQIPSQRYLQRF